MTETNDDPIFPEPRMETCAMCLRDVHMACRSTRDMEDRPHDACRAALMALGGGEYTENRMEAGRWLAVIETALSHDKATWGEPVTARHAPGTRESEIFVALSGAGFAEPGPGEGEWNLTKRGVDVAFGRRLPWRLSA